MNNSKKIISLLLSLVMIMSVFTIVPFTANAVEKNISAVGATSGTTGDCTWKISGKVLTISGNGKMGSYEDFDLAPWLSTSITEVVIKNGVTNIGKNAFAYTDIIKVTIPQSVKGIGKSAFYACMNLTNVIIPDSVTIIGNQAFSNCQNLNSVKIGNSVTTIGEQAFLCCFNLRSVTIGNSVTNIGECAFVSCSNLEQVIFPKSVKNIGNQSFVDCRSLNSVTIPDSVISIGDQAFRNCENLKHVAVPASVTSIGEYSLGYYYDWDYEMYFKTDGFTIEGVKGTTAENYAKTNGITFISLGNASYTIKGKITGYLSETDSTSILLMKDGKVKKSAIVKGNSAEYSFADVEEGTYTLFVSKKGHVSRNYSITVKDKDVIRDVEICPLGDVNGDGETDIMDCSVAQRYIRELTTLDAYQIACGDVSGTGDGELDIQDVSRILRHIRELAMLY